MAWVYLDDAFPDHPKVARAGGDAAWLFVCGLAYIKRYATEGTIPKAQVPKLSDRKAPTRLARRLVDADLWIDDGDVYRVHDYDDWNKPQESRSAAGRKAAKARWARETHANGNANAYANASEPQSESHSDPPSERNADPHASECPPPHPLPSYVNGGENLQAAASRAAPPQRKCPAHRHVDGPTPPCGACADARREHDAWQREHPQKPLDETAAAQRERTEAGAAHIRRVIRETPDPHRVERVLDLKAAMRIRQPEET